MSGTWQDRLVQERDELAKRLRKLELFQTTDRHSLLATEDIILLMRQQMSMEYYLHVLNQRLLRLE